MIIRKFLPSEAIELSQLIQETIVKSNSRDYSKKAVQYLCSEYSPGKLLIRAEKMDIFVATQKTKLLGTISMIGNRISSMFVSPRDQGKRIGSELVRYVEQRAKREGITTLKVRSSLTAYGFYQKLGYKKFRKASNKLIGQMIWMKKGI